MKKISQFLLIMIVVLISTTLISCEEDAPVDRGNIDAVFEAIDREGGSVEFHLDKDNKYDAVIGTYEIRAVYGTTKEYNHIIYKVEASGMNNDYKLVWRKNGSSYIHLYDGSAAGVDYYHIIEQYLTKSESELYKDYGIGLKANGTVSELLDSDIDKMLRVLEGYLNENYGITISGK